MLHHRTEYIITRCGNHNYTVQDQTIFNLLHLTVGQWDKLSAPAQHDTFNPQEWKFPTL